MADTKMINTKTSSLQISEQDPPNDQSAQDDPEDLQKFTHWDDNNGEAPMIDDVTQVNRGGWSVEEMFKKNQSLGVQSTFKDDLTQYTTVPAQGSKEDRARAAKIAKEIEGNEKSKRMAYLENDDEERDLDKETVIPDEAGDSSQSYHQQKRNSRGSKSNSKSFTPRKEIIVPENHRANALRDPPPPPRNRQLEHGRQRDRGNHGKSYQTGPSISGNNEGQNRQVPLPSQQQHAEPQNSANQKSQNFSRRKEDLKSWQNNFNAAYRQNSQSSSTSPQKTPVQISPPVQQQEQEPQFPTQQSQQQPTVNPPFQQPQPSAPIYPPRPTNAWQKGPPDFSNLQPQIKPQQQPQQNHLQQTQTQQTFVNPQFSQPPPNVTPSTVTVPQTENPVQEPQYTVTQGQEFEAQTNSISDVVQSEDTNQSESESSNTKFQFNPDAPAFVPRLQSQPNTTPAAQVVPIVTVAQQPHYIATQQPYSQGYATHIPQSLTNTLPPGYILTTQGVGMQPTFIPQQISYVPAGVPIYNHQQIVTSTHGGGAGGGYPSFVHHAQPQTFVVRSGYDMTNGAGVGNGYIQTNQHLPQLQYATMPLQQYHAPPPPPQPQQFQQPLQHQTQQQQQQQFQPQLPYSQPPPNGLRRYGQN